MAKNPTQLEELQNLNIESEMMAFNGTKKAFRAPLSSLTNVLNAGNLKMPDSDETIAEHYRTFSNRNLLDNWYFPTAVNQRRKDTYSAKGETAIYSIDRLLVGRANLSVNEDGISFAWDGVTSTNGYLQQRVPFPNLGGNTFTFSVLTADNHLISRVIEVGTKIGTNYGEFVFEHHIAMIIGNVGNNYAWCAIYSDTTAPTTLKAAKLELGRHQTLAHKENDIWILNEIPDYATELAKCQRYQQVFKALQSYSTVGVGFIHSKTQAVILIPLAVQLRSIPTLSYTGEWELHPGGGVSGIRFDQLSTDFARLIVTSENIAENLVQGSACTLRASNSNGSMIILDSNL